MKTLLLIIFLTFFISSCTDSGESSVKKKSSSSTNTTSGSGTSGSGDSGTSGSGDSGTSGSGDSGTSGSGDSGTSGSGGSGTSGSGGSGTSGSGGSGTSGSGGSDAPTYTISINGPGQVEIDQCSTAFTITLFESTQEFIVASDTNVDLNGNGNGSFYETNDCSGSAITSTTILNGNSSTLVYFKNSTNTDTHLLNVVATNFDSGPNKNVQITSASATQFTMTVPSDKSADTPTTISNINITLNGTIQGAQRIGGAVGSCSSCTILSVNVTGANGFAAEKYHLVGTSNYTGGIVGYASASTIEFSSVSNTKISGSSYTGGIVGGTGAHIYESFCLNNTVEGTSYVGGISGNQSSKHVKYCYNLGGSVSATGNYSGGLVGYSSSSNQTQNFVSTTFSSTSTNKKCANGYKTGGTFTSVIHNNEVCTLASSNSTGATTSDMQSSAYYVAASWDTYYWLLNANDYPELQWESF